ncbi:MAG TPA: DNA topoisomerase, partial [Ardenticatenaceae bacterium]|nr:DNA topoisomerase [Ardenticatenaceae bacterium]
GKLPEAAGLQGDEARLYKLIWGRFVASQMRPAIYDVTTAEVEVRREQGVLPYGFRAVGSVLRVPGWLALYGIKPGAMDDEAEEGARQALPALAAHQPLDLRELRPEQHWTQPPPRYSEASLIKALEQHGVGRPSTYATIMETIQARGYVERQGKMLAPTEAGRVVTSFLVERFPDLLDLKFTAQMESDLDRVAEGEVGWTELMARFYGPFHEKVQNARGERRPSLAQAVGRRTPEDGGRKGSTPSRRKIVRAKSPGAPPAEVGRSCPNCGKPLVMRRSRYGEFVGCSGYPQCRYLEKTAGDGATEDGRRTTTTRGRRRKADDVQTEAKAPRKGRRVAKGRARAGEASIPTVVDASTPAATTVQVEASNGSPAADPQTCPECGRPLATRNGRYGPFVGCTGYPTCRYTAKPS